MLASWTTNGSVACQRGLQIRASERTLSVSVLLVDEDELMTRAPDEMAGYGRRLVHFVSLCGPGGLLV